MDSDEGRRRGLQLPDPTPDIPDADRVEPWGWHDKAPPRHIRERLRLYREHLERLARGAE